MKKTILLLIVLITAVPLFAQYTAKGGKGTPLLVEDTGNKMQVYLLNGLSGAEISFSSSETGTHYWYKYKNRANEAVAIPCLSNGKTSTITDVEDGCGYFVGFSPNLDEVLVTMKTTTVWTIDYSNHLPTIFRVDIDESDKCRKIKLKADVEASPLEYYIWNGTPQTIPRTFHLLYEDLTWNEDALVFVPVNRDSVLENVSRDITIPAPLKNTAFTLSGDQFASHFGIKKEVKTTVYESIALEAHSRYESYKENGLSEQNVGGSDESVLRFSAPAKVNFTAYANEPVADRYIWTIHKIKAERGDTTTLVRYTDKSVSYTFDESGDYQVQLEVINAASNCYDLSQTYSVFVGESSLKLPNAFSPGGSIGVNDEYRVSYKSLVSFKASIFNRWGNLLFQWTDPAQGWDGRVNGSFVPTGVYFIVVEAKGADGVVYKESMDINILRSRR